MAGGIEVSANFDVKTARFLDSRQEVENLDELKSLNTNIIPDGFETYVKSKDCKYKYLSTNDEDPNTGKWRESKITEIVNITKEEFDKLSEEEKKDKLFVFTDVEDEEIIDDSSTTPTTLWSSEKTNKEINALVSSINSMASDLNSKITQLNTLLSGKAVINDSVTDTTTTWSGSKIDSSISGVSTSLSSSINSVSTSLSNSINSLTNTVNGKTYISDGEINTYSTWSSNKINSSISDVNTSLNSLTNTVNGKTYISDGEVNGYSTWSSNKINSAISASIYGSVTPLIENITAEGTYTLSQSIRNFNYIVVTPLAFGSPMSPSLYPAKLEKNMLIHLYNQGTFIGRAVFNANSPTSVTIDSLNWTAGINVYGVM